MTEKILVLNKEKYIFWMLAGALLLSVGFYIYLINATVRNVVAREKLEEVSSELALQISSQEFQYISLHNSVTAELAYAKGFKDTVDKKFISYKDTKLFSYLNR